MLQLIAADAPNGRHLPGDINEVYWGSLAFFVVIGLMIWLAGPAISRALKSRTERIEKELADAKAARVEAEAMLTSRSAELPDLGVEEERIRSEAVETAARLKADLIARATAEAEDIRTRGMVEVDNYRRQAVADLTAEVAEVTKNSAETIVVENLDDRSHGDLIDAYIAQVEQS